MVLRAEKVSKRYFRTTGGANHFFAVRDANLTLTPGAVVVLMGRSGSGKTTLLHMLAGLLTPTEGRVWLDDQDLYALADGPLSRLRNAKIGVVPQGRSAVDSLTVRENILLPGVLCGGSPREADAARWMEALGVAHLASALPAELSGGELRRVAIARALTQAPGVLLADEPTGDLDDGNTALVLSNLKDAAKRENRAVLIVSHDEAARTCADQVYRMDGGILS